MRQAVAPRTHRRGTSVYMRPGGLRRGDAGELRISSSSKGPLLVEHGERGGRLKEKSQKHILHCIHCRLLYSSINVGDRNCEKVGL